MKKFTYLLFLAIGVTSCSVESMDSTENLLTADAKYKLAVATSVDHDETVCLGDMANFTFNFPQATNNPGNNDKKTLVKLELIVNGEWVEIYGGNFEGEGPKYFSYDFGAVGTYQLQHRIGTGNNWTPISVNVENCDAPECPSGYMIGDLNFSEIGTSQNWGWAHKFEFDGSESETRSINNKKGSLGGSVTVSYNHINEMITVEEGDGVSITHLYISNDEPKTNAPGQFDKTKAYSDVDGSFWVIIKAEVCK